LLANRDPHGAWHSTQGTILALRALLAKSDDAPEQEIAIRANGADAGRVQLHRGAPTPEIVSLDAQVRSGTNIVELSAAQAAAFQLIVTYVQPWRDAGTGAEALSLSVDYGRKKMVLGDVVPVEVRLSYRLEESSGMVLLELGIPAGLTPVLGDLEPLVRSQKLARWELEAGHLNLYLDRLVAGSPLALSLRFRASRQVDTAGAPSLAYLYYHPEIRASAAPTGVVVN
jgi:hypothetical protein